MHKTIALGVIAALAISGEAMARDGLDWTYVEANYVSTQLDDDDLLDLDVDGDGFGLQGAIALAPKLHGYAEYTDQDFDFGVDLETWEIGLGLNLSVASNVDLIGRVAFAHEKVDRFGSENGYALQAGARALLIDRLELEGVLHYVDVDEFGDNTTFRGTLRYAFTDNFSLTGGAEIDSDATIWILGARYSFPSLRQ